MNGERDGESAGGGAPPEPPGRLPAKHPADGSGGDSGGPSAAPGSMAAIERTFLRLTFWQTLLSLAGVFTGAVALYAALNESAAVRQQTAAAVWPYVQVTVLDTDGGDTASFALRFANVGVGPARMQGMRLSHDGKAMRDWQQVVSTLIDEPLRLGQDYGKNRVSDGVLAPGDRVIAFQTRHPALARALSEATASGATSLDFCYCSIFDECWESGNEERAGAGHAREACPALGDDAFLE
ncbi:MAG: hypothetical protein V2I24_00210 [Halieaceae bacterium]|nr:hypothetical protein [Halieaceae bacterium]